MQTLFWLIFAAIAAAVAALHVLSAVFADKRSAVLNFINIALHIPLVFVMLYLGTPLELVALVFMSSLLIYVLAFECKRRCGKRGNDR